MTDYDRSVTLTIDDRQVTVPKGTLVVDAAAKLGIEIPVFCSHPKLDPVACCRMCLVEIRRSARHAAADRLLGAGGARAWSSSTDTQQVQDVQEANLAFILLNHPLDCPICDKGGECPLQDQTLRYGPGISQLVGAQAAQEQELPDLRHHRAGPGALRASAGAASATWRNGKTSPNLASSSAAATRSSTSRTASRWTPRPAATSSTSARWAR